jgi:hypothetical protein
MPESLFFFLVERVAKFETQATFLEENLRCTLAVALHISIMVLVGHF